MVRMRSSSTVLDDQEISDESGRDLLEGISPYSLGRPAEANDICQAAM
jgi:hypothetical protein